MEAQPSMTGPEINPEQAARVLRILGEWTRRRWFYEVFGPCGPAQI